jgi:hypothetical protein
MYCPNCATQNADDAKFCRGCGANLSLVPQALTGQLGLTKRQQRELSRNRASSLAHGITTSFTGLGFLLVAFAISMAQQVAGQVWWFWLLIPAFTMLGKGVAEIIGHLQSQKQQRPIQVMPPLQQQRTTGEIPASPPVNELPVTPVSVTETTTRHLDAVPPRNREIQ